jgi:hypothetical protein
MTLSDILSTRLAYPVWVAHAVRLCVELGMVDTLIALAAGRTMATLTLRIAGSSIEATVIARVARVASTLPDRCV